MAALRCAGAALALLLVTMGQAFQQNADHIARGADTNTQEDYHHVHRDAQRDEHLSVFILPHSHDDPGEQILTELPSHLHVARLGAYC